MATDPGDLPLGARATVRYRTADGSATDLIGRVASQDADAIVLVDRAGAEHRVDRSSVVAARRVPDVSGGPDPLRAPAGMLERIASQSWHDEVTPLGEWLLRFAGGVTSRANSCLALGDPGRPAGAAAEAIAGYAGQHGIPPMAQVVIGSAEETALRSQGWAQIRNDVDVLVCRLSELCALGRPTADVELDTDLPQDWFNQYLADHPGQAEDARVRRLLTCADDQFARIHRGDRLVAIGRMSIGRSWATGFGLWSAPQLRRQGLMRQVLLALSWWTADRGARSVQLQVDSANTGAATAYVRLGFVRHHGYRYLAPTT